MKIGHEFEALATGFRAMGESAREAGIALEQFLRVSKANQERHVRALKANPHRTGCYYREHVMLVNSGTFWRCRHGRADACARCAISHPLLYLRWHALPWLRRRAKPIAEGIATGDSIVGLVRVVHEHEADSVTFWLRLPSFDYVHDWNCNTWRMAQRVLMWTSFNGWQICYRFPRW